MIVKVSLLLQSTTTARETKSFVKVEIDWKYRRDPPFFSSLRTETNLLFSLLNGSKVVVVSWSRGLLHRTPWGSSLRRDPTPVLEETWPWPKGHTYWRVQCEEVNGSSFEFRPTPENSTCKGRNGVCVKTETKRGNRNKSTSTHGGTIWISRMSRLNLQRTLRPPFVKKFECIHTDGVFETEKKVPSPRPFIRLRL